MSKRGNFDRELEFVLDLLGELEPEILRIYATDFAVEYKAAGEGPVTEADKLISDVLCHRLREKFPGDGILSEEMEEFDSHRGHDRIWIIDPIDGTKEFVAKNGEFAVQIGLSVAGEARFGVVYQPTTGKIWHGGKGLGCFLLHNGGRRKMHCVPNGEVDLRQWTMAVSRSHHSRKVERVMAAAGMSRKRSSGCIGLKVALIASGEADVYMVTGKKTKKWDLCSPQAILEGAGGKVTDLRGHPYDFSGEELVNGRGILASRGAGHEEFIRLIDEILGSEI